MNNKGPIEYRKIIRGFRYAIIISLVISTLIILLTIDSDTLKALITGIKPVYLLVLVLVMLLNWLFAGIRLKFLIKTVGNDISLKDSITIYLSGAFVSNVTPFASGGGPFQVYFLHKKGVNVGKSSTVVVIQFILRLFFFGLLTPIFLVFFNWAISPGVIPVYLFYLAFGFGIFFSAGILILITVPRIIDKLIAKIFQIEKVRKFIKNSHRAKKLLVRGRMELREFRQSLEIMSQYRGRLFMAEILTVLLWAMLFLVIPLILLGFGLEPYFFRSYVMQTIFYLVLPYTPSPGASGIAEIGFASLFVSFIPANYIGLVTFAWRFFTFYFVLIVGGYFALKEIGKTRSYENE